MPRLSHFSKVHEADAGALSSPYSSLPQFVSNVDGRWLDVGGISVHFCPSSPFENQNAGSMFLKAVMLRLGRRCYLSLRNCSFSVFSLGSTDVLLCCQGKSVEQGVG